MPLKVGIVFGLNYEHSDHALPGCINDAISLRSYLLQTRHYDDVELYTDHTSTKPTKMNIMRALYNLMIRTHAQHIGEVWISYSGHGTQIQDTSGDETDSKDEALVPLDFKTRGVITDDLFRRILSYLHPRTRCVILTDCCHSGTIVDLPFRLSSRTEEAIDSSRPSTHPHSHPAHILHIAACRDAQTALDVNAAGVCTTAFLKVVHRNPGHITCMELLKQMEHAIAAAGHLQVVQMSSSRHVYPFTWFYCHDVKRHILLQ